MTPRKEWVPGLCMDCRDAPAVQPSLFCHPCAFRELEVERSAYRVSAPLLEKSEDLFFANVNHLPARRQRTDPTKMDREAA